MYINHLTVSQQLDVNLKGEDFFVGDIHGNKQRLLNDLSDIGFRFDVDRLISTGDIVDRGEDSLGCLALLDSPWFYATLGNHEEMLLKGFDNPIHWQVLLRHGGEWLHPLFNDKHKLISIAEKIVSKMPLTLTIKSPYGDFGVSHADSPSNWLDCANDEATRKVLMWSRELSSTNKNSNAIENIDFTIHGHNNLNQVLWRNNQLCIDTLIKTGELTIISAKQAAKLLSQR